ncbi:MAG: sulfurtransferase-like selenium metabolism protein YedF [Desulfobacterales bacterium]|nr:sulfurtransferase-like selenium metabolism protein YedF [Desulfobacterales bacterium]
MKEIKAEGLPCPAPVLLTKEAIDKGEDYIKITVDNQAAKENVKRFLEAKQFEVSIQEHGKIFHLIGSRKNNEPSAEAITEKLISSAKKIVVMVSSNRIGHGDDELGAKLMISFLKTLKEMGHDLWKLIFVNNGVKLCVEDSDVLNTLKDLEHSKVDILVCGTCLNHFNLINKKQVGDTTNMLDIVTSMQLADKVIHI